MEILVTSPAWGNEADALVLLMDLHESFKETDKLKLPYVKINKLQQQRLIKVMKEPGTRINPSVMAQLHKQFSGVIYGAVEELPEELQPKVEAEAEDAETASA